MTMILLYDLIEEGCKGLIRIMTSCIDTNARVSVFATREDGLLERKVMTVLSVLKLVPNFLG
jgi:hypothetical protein